MKISLDWLNAYLDRPAPADQVCRVLTDIGFPLDGMTEIDGDVVLDVEVTSNRPDVLCHLGVARELAAAIGRTLVEPPSDLPDADPTPITQLTSVDNRATDLCPLYTARVIRGVRIGPSPDWLVRRIQAIGLRPVNNVVDVTNFILHELAQPLHAFDMNRLDERRIVVRRAAGGERFIAIDSTKHELTENMLVIADAHRPVAVAGVMGGLDSEVGQTTTDILLESARFDPLSIRSTSRTLKLASDASYRFERGVDPRGVERASRRAARLIVELAGGKLAEGVIAVGQQPGDLHHVDLRPGQCRDLLGNDLPDERMIEILDALGLAPVRRGPVIRCTIPSHRLDLRREVDLIEEVARLHGYDNIAVAEDMHLTIRPPQPAIAARRTLDRVLTAHGYCQTITFSNIAEAHAQPFLSPDRQAIRLNVEQKRAEPVLRPNLLPSLLACRKSNQDVGNNEVKLYELATVFCRADGQYHERKHVALLADADQAGPALRRLRGTIEELLAMLGCEAKIIETDTPPPWAQPAARIVAHDDQSIVLGEYGLAARSVIELFDLQHGVALAWLDYPALIAAYPPIPAVVCLPRFPGIERDLSIVVDEPVAWARIAAAIDDVQPELLERLQFIGVYRGRQLGPGRKSVTMRMTFRHPDKTLRHEEVDGQVEQIVRQLKQDVNAELRA